MEGISSLQETIRHNDFFYKNWSQGRIPWRASLQGRQEIYSNKVGRLALSVQNASVRSNIRPPFIYQILKPIVTFLRSQGHRLVIYLDDLLLLSFCKKEAEREFFVTTALLENCGFVINAEKSIGNPQQIIEYLGLIVNSKNLARVTCRES